jgi:hypothetical protein
MGARNVLLKGRRLEIAGGYASGWRVAQTPRTAAYRRGGEAVARSRGLAKTHPGVAAIRIPERMSAQLAPALPYATPQLFVHEGARQALERRLMSAFPGIVTLSITDNRHSIISHSCKNGVLRARVHHMFLDAPPRVVRALVRYVTQGDQQASTYVGDYIDQNGARLARRRRGVALVAKGKRHDLLPIFNELNEKYFGGAVNALFTWGKRGSTGAKLPRRTIKLGSYSALDRLIRIHPALDRKWVPRYFVSYIMYHEMLHHVIPASRGSGRRMLHPPEFRAREQDFRHFDRAIAWEKQHIGRLLRSR